MSHKVRADQIRTINKDKYRFSVNGKEWRTIDQMLEVSWLLHCGAQRHPKDFNTLTKFSSFFYFLNRLEPTMHWLVTEIPTKLAS